jgi:hypothetical protein
LTFFGPDGRGGINISAGTVPRIAGELRRRGHEVHVVDLRRFDTLEFARNEELLGSVNPAELRMLQAMVQNPMGRLCIPPGGLRERAVGLLCRYYHEAKVLIPSATIKQAEEMASALAEQLGGNVDLVHNRQWRSPARVVCCTLSSFESAEPYDWNILIFPAGEQLLARRAISGWQDFNNPYYFPRPHRIYAFMAPSQRNSQATELRLEALTGPVIYQAPTILGQRAAVRVLFATAPWSPPGNRVSPLEDMRRLYWHNGTRKDLLAALVRACRRADLEALWPHGLLLDAQQFPVGSPGAASVAVLVESPEHGRELQTRLAGWPLYHAETSRNSRSAGRNPARCAWGLPDEAIVTLVRAAQLRQLDTDVLVMATGRSVPALPGGFPPLVASGEQRQALIVDVDDDFDRAARHDTRQRLAYYQARGFEVDAPSRWRTGQRGRSR